MPSVKVIKAGQIWRYEANGHKFDVKVLDGIDRGNAYGEIIATNGMYSVGMKTYWSIEARSKLWALIYDGANNVEKADIYDTLERILNQ